MWAQTSPPEHSHHMFIWHVDSQLKLTNVANMLNWADQVDAEDYRRAIRAGQDDSYFIIVESLEQETIFRIRFG